MSDVTTSELAERLGEPGLVLLDVRRPEEFTGDVVAPCDPRPGHIPGARNVDVALLFEAPGPDAVHVLAAAGYAARNYPGSWHEWSRDPGLPADLNP